MLVCGLMWTGLLVRVLSVHCSMCCVSICVSMYWCVGYSVPLCDLICVWYLARHYEMLRSSDGMIIAHHIMVT